MPKLTGEIRDSASGHKLEARVQVLLPGGEPICPLNALKKVGPGEPFFYSGGQFSVEARSGYHRVLVERGTEYRPWSRTVHLTSGEDVALDVSLERWADLPDRGWHPGNTHIHYDEKETRPDERLRFDSRVEDLRMTAISILKRWDLKYATNKYPIGVLNEYTDTHHLVQNGEESRHNREPWEIGYGHVMLLNLRNIAGPVSRGLLVDAFDPDYPPLSYVCDDARRQGGLVIWCHNGQGMEAPVAAALGKLDAMNLFDPYWNDTEYDLWYRMLNCGIRLPASTGSDWFVCSANRVYSQTGGEFRYEPWLQGVREGRTFITNGPAIFMTVNGAEPGQTVQAKPGDSVEVTVSWSSHYAVESVEIVSGGVVAARRTFPASPLPPGEGAGEGRGKAKARRSSQTSGRITARVPVGSSGWVAARLGSTVRDSFAQPIWAHTSPVYIEAGNDPGPARRESARWFAETIDRSMEWVSAKGRFYTDAQRREVLDLFRQGQEVYRRMTG
jgi:hypothetical protein